MKSLYKKITLSVAICIVSSSLNGAILAPKPGEGLGSKGQRVTKKNNSAITEKSAVISPVALLTSLGSASLEIANLKGVAFSSNVKANIVDINNSYDNESVWNVANLINNTLLSWPKGTVFLALVGEETAPIVATTRNGYFIIAYNNGLLDIINKAYKVDEFRNLKSSNQCSALLQHNNKLAMCKGVMLASKNAFINNVGDRLSDKDIKKLDFILGSNGEIVSENKILSLENKTLHTNLTKKTLDLGKYQAGDNFKIYIKKDGEVILESTATFTRDYNKSLDNTIFSSDSKIDIDLKDASNLPDNISDLTIEIVSPY